MSYQVRNEKLERCGDLTASDKSWKRERGEVFRKEADQHFSTVEVLQRFCEVNGRECEWADEYGEPGYGPAEKGILLCNWNHIPKALHDRLEAQGFELEWSDEWAVDYSRSPCKAYRTQPDSHGWECRLRMTDGDYLFPDDDPEDWIADALNENNRPLPSWFDEAALTAAGFALLDGEDKEVGFHPGQDETPEKFTPAITARGDDFVLQVTDRGQFDVRYRIWIRSKDYE